MQTTTSQSLPQASELPDGAIPFPGAALDWLTIVWPEEEHWTIAVNALTAAGFDPEAAGISRHWVPRGKGNLNYADSATKCNASIFWAGRTGREGVMLQLSGQACRELEALGTDLWELIRQALLHQAHVTRLDLATDDLAGHLPVDEMLAAFRSRHFRSRAQDYGIIQSHSRGRDGWTLYLGSRSSDRYLRIYNKAAEQGYTGQWVRVELELKGDAAQACAAHWVCAEFENPGRLLRTLLADMLTVTTPTQDSNRSRWPVAEWWSDFLADVSAKVHLSRAPRLREIEDRLSWLWTQTRRTLTVARRYFVGEDAWQTFLDALTSADITVEDAEQLAQAHHRDGWTFARMTESDCRAEASHVLSTPVLLAGGTSPTPA